MFHATDVVWKSPPHLERSFSNSKPGVASTENLVLSQISPDELLLGLDILRTYEASVDLGRQTLRLAKEEVLLWSL
jgi:hypothetical protein